MPKVKFTEDVIYETEGYKKGERFEKGEVYDLSEAHAERWIRRKLATPIKEKNEKKAKADEPEVVEETSDDEEEQEEEEGEETEGETHPTMPRRRGRPPKVR